MKGQAKAARIHVKVSPRKILIIIIINNDIYSLTEDAIIHIATKARNQVPWAHTFRTKNNSLSQIRQKRLSEEN